MACRESDRSRIATVGARRQPLARRLSLLLLSLAAIVFGCYVAYVPFEEWWYLRFLLPAIPLLCALMAVAIVVLARHAGRPGGLVALAVFGALAWHGLSVARDRAAFDLWRMEQRLSATATYIRDIAPNVVAIAIQPGGAIHFTLNRPVVSWDALEPRSLDRVVSWAGARGDRALIVVDGGEAEEFRTRFSSFSAYGALEWPPRAVIGRTVLVFDPADRARYLAGEYVPDRASRPGSAAGPEMSASARAETSAIRRRLAQVAMAIALCAAAAAVVVAATGGFAIAIAGLRISVRSLPAPLAAFVIAAVVALALSPTANGRRVVLDWLASPQHSGPTLAAILAVAALATGVGAGTWVAGGAHASGYVSQARLLASGRLARVEPLARDLALDDAPGMVSPLGFRPAADARVTARLVPTYAPGLPLLMAGLSPVAGSAAPFLVVPICGALAVWMTFALGRTLGHPGAGVAAALLLLTNPSFLYQVVQPMSDVPAAAAWLSAAVLALGGRAVPCGVATGLAILIRPNLAPMAVPMAVCLVTTAVVRVPSAPVFRWLVAWALGAASFVAVAGVLHTLWYGAPWRSGYGGAEALFATGPIGPNVLRYGRWLLESCGAAAIVVASAAARPPIWRRGRLPAAYFVAAALANAVVYLPYFVFDDWHYIRFLLPAIALLLPLGCVTVVQSIGGLRDGSLSWTAAVALVVVTQGAWQLHSGRIARRLPSGPYQSPLRSDRRLVAPAHATANRRGRHVAAERQRVVERAEVRPPLGPAAAASARSRRCGGPVRRTRRLAGRRGVGAARLRPATRQRLHAGRARLAALRHRERRRAGPHLRHRGAPAISGRRAGADRYVFDRAR